MALAVALVFGLAIHEAQARPGGGGRGAGPRPGGARPGNVRPGNIQSGNVRPQIGQQNLGNLSDKLQSGIKTNSLGNATGNWQNKVSQLKTNFTSANQPFTPSWYANHPQAWQYTHPHADAWAVATFGAAAAWLAIPLTNNGYVVDDEVYTSDTDDQTDEQEYATDDGQYMPLGVFALAPQNEKDASALVQLAVNKQGNLRGNYYDALTGQDQIIAGRLDKKTQKATFQVSPNGSVSFETTLANLTQPSGIVTLRFASGRTRQWTLARFDDPAAQTN